MAQATGRATAANKLMVTCMIDSSTRIVGTSNTQGSQGVRSCRLRLGKAGQAASLYRPTFCSHRHRCRDSPGWHLYQNGNLFIPQLTRAGLSACGASEFRKDVRMLIAVGSFRWCFVMEQYRPSFSGLRGPIDIGWMSVIICCGSDQRKYLAFVDNIAWVPTGATMVQMRGIGDQGSQGSFSLGLKWPRIVNIGRGWEAADHPAPATVPVVRRSSYGVSLVDNFWLLGGLNHKVGTCTMVCKHTKL